MCFVSNMNILYKAFREPRSVVKKKKRQEVTTNKIDERHKVNDENYSVISNKFRPQWETSISMYEDAPFPCLYVSFKEVLR